MISWDEMQHMEAGRGLSTKIEPLDLKGKEFLLHHGGAQSLAARSYEPGHSLRSREKPGKP